MSGGCCPGVRRSERTEPRPKIWYCVDKPEGGRECFKAPVDARAYSRLKGYGAPHAVPGTAEGPSPE